MNNSLLPHAPSLDEPLEMLEACHDRIEAQLKTLERLVPHLAAHGNDGQAQQAALAILRYFDRAGPNHHEDEEKDLFPTLRQRVSADDSEATQSLIDELLRDHAQMALALAAVRQQLHPLANGQPDGTLDAASVQRLATLYRQHIDKENQRLLPLARRTLSAADIATLSQHMTARRRQPD